MDDVIKYITRVIDIQAYRCPTRLTRCATPFPRYPSLVVSRGLKWKFEELAILFVYFFFLNEKRRKEGRSAAHGRGERRWAMHRCILGWPYGHSWERGRPSSKVERRNGTRSRIAVPERRRASLSMCVCMCIGTRHAYETRRGRR